MLGNVYLAVDTNIDHSREKQEVVLHDNVIGSGADGILITHSTAAVFNVLANS